MTPPETGAGRWTRRFPRLTAALVSLMAGSAVAAFMAALFMSLGNPFSHVFGFFLYLEGTMVLPASVWAFALFGPHTRRVDHGPLCAVFTGIACVMLAIPTFAVFDLLMQYLNNKMNDVPVSVVFLVLFDVFTYLGVSLLMVFLPQMAGALGGFAIWRLTRGEQK